MEEILINMGVSALLTSIKNPSKKASMKKIFLKVFKSIWLNFANDSDFQAVVGISDTKEEGA